MSGPRIDAVQPRAVSGLIGMTDCPGRSEPGLLGLVGGGRDLDADLEALERWGATALVTLLERWELSALRVPRLPERAAPRFAYHRLAIADGEVPEAAAEAAWERVRPKLHERLHGGERVVLHCRAGLGRTGTMAARLLVELGEAPREAIARVRAVRPGALETARQVAYVEALARG